MERRGKAVIFKNNKPTFVVLDIDKADYINISDDGEIDVVAARILRKFRPVFDQLAK